jgi:hypothetical protein
LKCRGGWTEPRDKPVALTGFTGAPAEQGRAILAAMAEGKLTPSEAASLLSAIANQVKIAEADELTRRVAALEAKDGKP